MIYWLLDWLDAELVQPPQGKNTQGQKLPSSELVMLKLESGTRIYGYAVYEKGKFKRWSSSSKVLEWAYYK